MNCADYSTSVLPCEISQNFHHICGCERVKASRRLVKEDKTWISDEFDTDWGTLSLSTRDTLDKRSTDPGVGTLSQLEVHDESVDAGNFLSVSTWQFKFGSELKTLSYSHRLEQNIVLLHVGWQLREIANTALSSTLSIDQNRTSLLEILWNFTSRQVVKQSSLTCARCANDCQELSRLYRSRNTPNNVFWLF